MTSSETQSSLPENQAPAQQTDRADSKNLDRDNSNGTADDLDGIIPPHAPQSLPVVGLGGSAGAIPALRDFFSLMPHENGMAFVVVMHLSASHQSNLSEILQASTRMKVVQVKETTRLEANCVYVIPPEHHLEMHGGQVHLAPIQQARGKRVAVDLFLRTLADSHGTSAIGIVLSGADGDGAIGLKRIKERGGLTIAQDPEEAEHDSMPRSAIATGMVDWILPVSQMPAKLVAHRENESKLQLPPEVAASPEESAQRKAQQNREDAAQHADETALREVPALLRARTGHDFSHYKRATVQRLRSDLLTTIEKYEVSVEDLKASNEELQSLNEEAQSTAEELETSTEELQSLNEEMVTVNQELKSKVEELGRANSDLGNLIVATDIGTIFLDCNLQIKRFTPRAAQLFNFLPADVGRPLSHLKHNLDYSDLAADAERVLAHPAPLEKEVRAQDGRWFLTRLLPYLSSEGRIDGVVLTLIDITSRKQHEDEAEKLARQMERQARIFDTTLTSISDFAYVFDRDGRFVYSNQPLLDLLGLTLEEIVGKNFFDLNYPQDLAVRLHQQVQQVLETREFVRDETPFTSPAGEPGFYEYILTPVVSDDGTVEAVAGSTRDVTARRKIENELRESEARFRAIVNQATAGFAEFDLSGRHVFANQMFRDALGYSCEQLLALNLRDVVHPDDLPRCLEIFKEAVATGESFSNEKRLLRKDGSILWVNDSISCLRDTAGRAQNVVAVTVDITARKQAEETLRRAHDELEERVRQRTRQLAAANEELSAESVGRLQLEKAREQLLQRVVNTQEEERRRISRELHDQFGQQLTALLLGLKSLPDFSDPGLRPPSINQRIETLQNIVDGLMQQVHKLAWELRPAELDNFGLEPALRQYVQEWSEQCGIPAEFVSRAAATLARLPADVETALYRVVQEALTNVQRHAQAKNVSVLLECQDDHIVVIIEDDGRGFQIEQDAMGALRPSSKRLGMLGMQERIELVRGTLTVESSPSGGTTVYARVLAERRLLPGEENAPQENA